MAALPKTNMNYRPYQAFAVANGFTLTIPANVGLTVLTSAAAISSGANEIFLPDNAADGDEYYIVSQRGVTGTFFITVSAQATANGVTLLGGPGAVSGLTAGIQVGYLRIGNNWMRIQ